MALRIRLKSGERAILGGAVIRNGASTTELFVENEIPVLRESDVLRPAEVRTPCERIYLTLQLLYVGQGPREWCRKTFLELAGEVVQAAPSCAPFLRAIEHSLDAGRPFRALREARRLLAHEKGLLAHAC